MKCNGFKDYARWAHGRITSFPIIEKFNNCLKRKSLNGRIQFHCRLVMGSRMGRNPIFFFPSSPRCNRWFTIITFRYLEIKGDENVKIIGVETMDLEERRDFFLQNYNGVGHNRPITVAG